MDQRYTQRSRHTSVPPRQMTSRDFDESEYDEEVFTTRTPSSARRYTGDVKAEVGRRQADVQSTSFAKGDYQMPARKSAVPARRTATQSVPAVRQTRRPTGPVETDDTVSRRNGDLFVHRQRPSKFDWSRFHWSVYVGITMLIILLGWIGVTSFASWWQVTQDDLHYGRPRTFQIDAVVGHNDSPANKTHFIAINLDRHVQVIEISGSDVSKEKVYTGPVLIGQGQDLAVVTLSFKDVNGDGKPDMIINVQDSRFVFINENGAFRPARSTEKIQL